MWPLSPVAAETVRRSHAITARAIITGPTGSSLPLPIADGAVEIDAGSKVRRTAKLEADPRLWPRSPTDLLAPFGSSCTIEYGVVLPLGGVEWIPLGVFVLQESSRSVPVSGTGGISVDLEDRASLVIEDRLAAPGQTVTGATVVAEIARLCRDTLGADLPVIDLTGSTQLATQMEIDKERWDTVDKLATSIGAEAFFDPLGRLTVRPVPNLEGAPVWTVSTGPGGNLISRKDTLTRANVYNAVTVSSSRSDGSAGITVTVLDDDPRSPTRWGGPFGRKRRFYASPQITTAAQATTAGKALLARCRGLSATSDPTILVNPAADAGDLFLGVDDAGNEIRQILDKATIPLAPGTARALTCRTDTLPAEG